MASRGFHTVSDSSPNSPCLSYQSISGTESPSFYSPLSLSPDIETMPRAEEVSGENAPLITHENHYGNNQSELNSMFITFRDSSSSSEAAEAVSFWKHIR